MEIYYSSRKLEKILTNNRQIKKEYGLFYSNLINRLSELVAANNLSEIPTIPPPRRHKLSGDKKDCWGIDCNRNHRIVIEPFGEYNIEDLKTITAIKIINIEDYH